ncbi:ABC transporter substrate-binding protein [Roseomonas sp. OT10]|uniref:ABC transporter substrate-binding protein n=1 Tax=Roseomonas cutis TaxID=2897332 RepID=UPI001E5185BE|nr:ABC transporter substrate-binding protein [Roseomonas sp. OT10]UFN50329.1 ABC transporter substrate-binding protein [Roseomonas sp. OT10]
MLHRRTLLTAAAAAPLLARPALAQPAVAPAARARTLRFVPQAALTVLDPIFLQATITTTHGFCVFDTLYATDTTLALHPQMAEGHSVSDDGLTWTVRLREGLKFHDGEPVRATDCIASLERWASRDLFGQILRKVVGEWRATDDRTFTVRLTRPFPAFLYALGKPASVPCFIMPERLARTPGNQPITEITGSGPWRFLADEFVSGSRVAYARNDAYVPREEPANGASGGKRVHFDRLEWHIIPDGATAAAALRTGEVDWVEYPLPDLVPQMQRDPHLRTQVYDPTGFLGVLRPNHLHPPFDRVEVRRALRDMVSQPDHMASVAQPNDWQECHAMFPCTLAGVENRPAAPRDLDRARAIVKEAGQAGAKVVILNPSDFAAIAPQGRLAADLLTRMGLNVDLVETDWATVLQRRTNRDTVEKGGWSLLPTNFPAGSVANPAVNYGVRGDGASAWFGWPTDPVAEAAIQDWLYAPDAAAQAVAFRAVQQAAWDSVPFIPTGLFVLQTGFRADLSGVLQGPNPYLWNVKRA